MRLFVLLLVLLPVGPMSIRAQDALAVQQPAVGQATEAADTIAAIHRLFAAKRRQSAAVVSATAGTGLLCLAIAESTRHSYTIDTTPIVATGISLLSIPLVATEIDFYRQFTRQKEERAIAAFIVHRLPKKIKRRLRSEYFVAAPVTKHR